MSLILVIERDAPTAERIRGALGAEGYQVMVVADHHAATDAVASRSPELVLVDAEHEQARALCDELGVGGGGPGVLVVAGAGASPPPARDALLEKPFNDQQLRMAVRRYLSSVQRAAAEAAAEKAASSGAQLTSEDLFGDMLAEVERAGTAEEKAKRPEPAPAKASDDVDRKLEDTLSGVLDIGKKRPAARPTGTKPKVPKRTVKTTDDVDDLLNQTLSGLGVTSKPRPKAPAAREVASAPEVDETPPVAAVEAPDMAPPAEPEPEPELEVMAAAADEPEVEADEEPVVDEAPAIAAQPEGEEAFATQRLEVVRPPSPAAKKTFGQYTLLDRIAVGGMAEVWKARMKGVEGFQKNVAIKKILSHLTDSVDFVTMFIDEAKLAAQLNHPNIIHIYDLGKIDDDYFIAMEYVEGKDLRTILNTSRDRGRELDRGLAVLVASRLASALDYAHRKRDFEDRDLGLVHRDVSPQNVLISFEGDIKLCDFGIVKAVAKASKTQMGALKGKLQYMSPEQAWGKVVDSRSDIFSLGSVLFEMLTGRRLFAGDSEISVLESVRECRIESPRALDSGIPETIDAVVLKALARDPDDRYQTAGEMQKELEAILYALDPTPGQGDLTDLMGELFGAAPAAAESASPAPAAAAAAEVEPSAEAAARGVGEAAPGSGEEVAAVAPRTDLTAEAEPRGKGLWIAAAAAVVLLAVIAVWQLTSGAGTPSDEASGQPAETVSIAVPRQQEVPSPATRADGAAPGDASGEGGIGPDGEPVESPADSQATSEAGGESPEASPGEAAEEDVEALVEQQLREREEEMRRQFEERKRDLEAQLEEAAQTPEEPAAEVPPAEPEPEPAATEPAAAVAESGAGTSGQGSEEAGGQATTPPTAEEVADAASQAPTPAPTPVAAPPPEPEPEPAPPPEPAVERGDLVELSDPGVVRPRVVSIEPPPYPPIAARLRVGGTVVVGVLVDENGDVAETRLISGVPQNVGINEAGLEAAESAKFEPATKDGVPVKVWYQISIPFKL